MQIREMCGYRSKFLVSTMYWVFIASVWNRWLSRCCWITEISAITDISKGCWKYKFSQEIYSKTSDSCLCLFYLVEKTKFYNYCMNKRLPHHKRKIAGFNIKYIRLGSTCNLQQEDRTWQFKLRWLDVAQGQLVEEAEAQVHPRNISNFVFI